jgi:hypothetical protein
MGLKYLSNIGKNAAKTVGSFALGFLPEQKLLERKISWYNADKGVLLSGLTEFSLGIVGFCYFGFTDNSYASLASYGLFLQSFARTHDDLGNNFNKKKIKGENISRPSNHEPLGNLFLEVPYRFLKNNFRRDGKIEGLLG